MNWSVFLKIADIYGERVGMKSDWDHQRVLPMQWLHWCSGGNGFVQ